MFVELIESLRCPNEHEETPLVVSATRTENRYIVAGTLGCPICGAEFGIVDGVARFAEPDTESVTEPASEDVAMHLAAFLQLTDAHGAAVLCGRFASHGAAISAVTDAPLIYVNARVPVDSAAGALRVRDVLPVAAGSLRGAALDESVSSRLARSIVRAIRARGRVVAPASVVVPAGIDVIARDERVWVGEKSAAPESAPRLVTIKRAST